MKYILFIIISFIVGCSTTKQTTTYPQYTYENTFEEKRASHVPYQSKYFDNNNRFNGSINSIIQKKGVIWTITPSLFQNNNYVLKQIED